ncbi:MAG: transporter substrate-binding domain-containing protein [Alcanivoracaceae bacterium]|nr:transporter substrate-binding domain-containing protein [Alcanivoracaceae bacterium]
MIRLAFFLLMLLATPLSAEVVIRHLSGESANDARNEYFLAVLSLALEKTAAQGAWRLEPADDAVPQSQALQLLSNGEDIDVVWSMTSIEREKQNRAIRIPLMKGLMGYRLLIIRGEDQQWFRRLQTIDELRELRAGQGHDWPDAKILRANGLSVEAVTDYENLFTLLQQGRFDYLPRAINEPWEELAARPDMDLVVEKGLLLYYPTAEYFFVNSQNTALAARLEKGLRIAIEDGSFDKLFREHPINANAFGKADLLHRRVIRLDNPLLPQDTPFAERQLWWPGAGR